MQFRALAILALFFCPLAARALTHVDDVAVSESPTVATTLAPTLAPSPEAASEASTEPVSEPSPSPVVTPAGSSRANTFSFGTMDRGLGLSYERFLDNRFAIQVQADSQNTDLLGSYGLGGSVRFYPTGTASPSFYGALRARIFDQSGRGNGPVGFYRGLRGGPQAGIRLPLYKRWVLTYDLAWSWDISLYQSDPANLIGEAWMSDVNYAGAAGRISDAVCIGWTY